MKWSFPIILNQRSYLTKPVLLQSFVVFVLSSELWYAFLITSWISYGLFLRNPSLEFFWTEFVFKFLIAILLKNFSQ